jgi:hypothetical protein
VQKFKEKAELSTNFLVTHLNSWQAQDAKPEIAAIATILEQILPTMTNAAGQATANTNAHIAPWQALGAWRIDKYHKS